VTHSLLTCRYGSVHPSVQHFPIIIRKNRFQEAAEFRFSPTLCPLFIFVGNIIPFKHVPGQPFLQPPLFPSNITLMNRTGKKVAAAEKEKEIVTRRKNALKKARERVSARCSRKFHRLPI